ncbi:MULTISPECIES: valine--tRNA ligase [Psychrobacter]|jgi:valyl-tRNA synthetase|uniref:valine--tRNA ligase n=1 Tax=Psychrobacter TaxID=497 RepID=UPI00086890B0|nr:MULTISPECIES: valine--tRNA ligase [Psychrobacter]MBA6244612.1 valine--tRNA ligase [Psychrobacter sp. Urea-trap-18]MBA6285112.1 valine--tRNA ligase [Psychrobacter sp. Urea-trap-16]MBA6319515.1 valine--tRNA ligase [Psychrobacter sp. Urea-trap-20]MBA6334088.1 valine--tRNA ligase [Psychrobacter sp. Urea-trap-19]OEH67469.1 MAG: valine--tRNA ligase [Psychrobacter sp. B29-1]|tara:strand:+ start:40104 stop:43073 length:2970 start_codon:yes stop_codon:yes gene_type:complete
MSNPNTDTSIDSNAKTNLTQSIQAALSQLESAYNPAEVEAGMYQGWEESGYFQPTFDKDESFSIALPPPNVTGSLHMGHGFNNAIMDALTRYHRMDGDNTLWQPGTDHAGIATQMVVERRLEAQGIKRRDMTRADFIDKVWEWKEESGGNITSQIRRLGSSVDWSRERFTMDDGLSNAVKEVFVRLFDDGLIYRGKRLVNWDPKFQTALSDLEVENHDEKGSLWHFRYHFTDTDLTTQDGKNYLVVATTRPETLLGDTAVAVNPSDERYAHLVGKTITLPITGRVVPIVADDYVEKDFGTGCVKITPAHDFNDYELGRRHSLPLINILDERANILPAMEVYPDLQTREPELETTPSDYAGLERFAARKFLVEQAGEQGWLEDIEDYALKAPRAERGGTIVEPWLTDQWYVAVKELAKPAIDAVEDGSIEFVPAQYKNMYMAWMTDLQDWCISRQLWWGHRIPAWYDDATGEIYVARDEAEVRTKYNLSDDVKLRQDDDVLDTWFSSGLWTFSTLDWADANADPRVMDTFHPTSVLVTGFDIIFFWVARMIMMTMHFVKNEDGTPQVPFKTVYVHGLVRDGNGQKMSKSKGNVLDPIDLIDGIELEALVEKRTSNMMNPKDAAKIEKQTRKEFPEGIPAFGTDALRFTFTSLASTGRDINFDLKRVEGYRNFCNKIWNASRFVLMNCVDSEGNAKPIDQAANPDVWELPEKWIMSRLNSTVADIHQHFAQYRLDMVSQDIYEFIWNEYCDWYVELAKASLNDDSVSSERKAQIRYVLLHVLETALRFSHPIMPYLTEQIWQTIAPLLGRKNTDSIVVADYPQTDASQISEQTEADMAWLQELIASVRNIRGEMKLGNAVRLPVLLQNVSSDEDARLSRIKNQFKALAKVESLEIVKEGDEVPLSSSSMVGQLRVLVPMKGLIDPTAELARLGKAHEKLQKQADGIARKLGNEGFVSKAPAEVVDAEKAKLAELEGQLTAMTAQMEQLKAL